MISYFENMGLFVIGVFLLILPLFFLSITTDAFIIPKQIALAANRCNEDWANKLRTELLEQEENAPFTSKNSMLARDQGVRGISMFANDFFYQAANSSEWDFNKFIWEEDLDELLL